MFSLSKLKNSLSLKEHWILSSVLLWSGFVCLLFVTYLTYGITRASSVVIFIFGIGGALLLHFQKSSPHTTSEKSDRATCFGYATSIFLYVALGIFAYNQQTNAALRSPWEVLPIWFFGVYALALSLLMIATYRDKTRNILALCAITAHIGLTYSIALLTFRFGYAYDPLIHQTAEKYVAAHGSIDPIQPFYIGQYALVAFLHFITTLPVEIIDRILVPALATITIPIIGTVGFRDGWNMSNRSSRIATLALTAIPIAEFTFTVPHNMTVLYALWWILLLPLALRSPIGRTMLLLLASAICTIHPLIGVPIIIATVTAILQHRFDTKFIPITGMLTIGCSLALMFGVYRFLQGIPFFATHNPLSNIANFFSIFASNATTTELPLFLTTLYKINYVIPFAIITLGFYFAYKYTHIDRVVRITLLSLTTGSIIAIFFVSTLIYIPGIAQHEQNEFMFRLRSVLPLFLLPVIITNVSHNKKLRTLSCAIIIALSTMSLYFSYPRVDGATWPGWNISQSDIEAVQEIEKITAGQPYVVLSHQVMAATGLREIGFERRLKDDGYDTHQYPIGITEMIYPFAEEVLYTQLNGARLRALADIIGGSVFVAVHDYWYRHDQIIAEALAQDPDKIYIFGQVTIFKFNAR